MVAMVANVITRPTKEMDSTSNIENCLSNHTIIKQATYILSKANYILTYTGSETTKDLSKEYEQNSTEEKQTIGSILFSEEDKRLYVYSLPCD